MRRPPFQVTRAILDNKHPLPCRPEWEEWVMEQKAMLMPAPPNNAEQYWRFFDQLRRPSRWLPHMVYINKQLEHLGAKLYTPLPLQTTFVPGHVRIDSQGFMDLLVHGQDELSALKTAMEERDMLPPPPPDTAGPAASVPRRYALPGLVTIDKKRNRTVQKTMFTHNLADIVAPHLVEHVRANPIEAGARYRTDLWQCLTRLGRATLKGEVRAPLRHDGLVFDTDGVAVSLHYVKPELFGKTVYNGGFKELKGSAKIQKASEKAFGSDYVTNLPASDRAFLLSGEAGAVLAADPGKGVILLVTDGVKVVRYTLAQRRHESSAAKNSRELRRLAAQKAPGGHSTYGQLVHRIGIVPGLPSGVRRSSKSCHLDRFGHYLQTRLSVAPVLRGFFIRLVFRKLRYRAYCGYKSSEDKLFHRVRQTYGKVAIILYGDWGRNPNLRHQPPSPGVGLRRRVAKRFNVGLTHEAYTSSRCPKCSSSDLEHPRLRGVRDRRTGRFSRREIHHLLRCPNERCACRWWNRDVLGALNILKTGRYALETGQWHPTFAAG